LINCRVKGACGCCQKVRRKSKIGGFMYQIKHAFHLCSTTTCYSLQVCNTTCCAPPTILHGNFIFVHPDSEKKQNFMYISLQKTSCFATVQYFFDNLCILNVNSTVLKEIMLFTCVTQHIYIFNTYTVQWIIFLSISLQISTWKRVWNMIARYCAFYLLNREI
jgi:hypothetical protein